MTAWRYRVPNNGEERDEHRRIVRGDDQREAAEAAARDYFRNRDGWEDSWPLDFAVARIEDNGDEGPEWLVSVALDYDPTFTAAKPRSTTP